MVRSNVLLPSSSLRCVSLYHSLDGRTPDILGPTCPPRNRQQSVDRLRPSLHPYRSGMARRHRPSASALRHRVQPQASVSALFRTLRGLELHHSHSARLVVGRVPAGSTTARGISPSGRDRMCAGRDGHRDESSRPPLEPHRSRAPHCRH